MKNRHKIAVILTALFGAASVQAADTTTQITKTENSQMQLTAKQQSLAKIGALTATGDISALKIAVAEALDNDLTINEIKDAMVQLYAYTGFPRSLNALNALAETVKER